MRSENNRLRIDLERRNQRDAEFDRMANLAVRCSREAHGLVVNAGRLQGNPEQLQRALLRYQNTFVQYMTEIENYVSGRHVNDVPELEKEPDEPLLHSGERAELAESPVPAAS